MRSVQLFKDMGTREELRVLRDSHVGGHVQDTHAFFPLPKKFLSCRHHLVRSYIAHGDAFHRGDDYGNY